MKFAVVIPTLNAGGAWSACVNAIRSQTLVPDKVLVIDSGSSDRTALIAKDAGFEVIEIERSDFNHGGTRQLAVEKLTDFEVLIFMTQDAQLSNVDAFELLLRRFDDDRVGAVNGRQLPRPGARAIEAHARLYNYPPNSYSRYMTDVGKYGLKAAFLSNSFSAYRRTALAEVGGFPADAIFGEDMYVAAKLLKIGYTIAYAADACVLHSHDYSLKQEFKRYFDMGVFHARNAWLRQDFGTAESEGRKFVMSEFRYLLSHGFWRIPGSMVRTVLRYAGFRAGLAERYIPLNIKENISMSPGYFKKN